MILYHASPSKNLQLIKPQRTLSQDKYIGDFVFATANKNLAIMYLVPKGYAYLMNPDDDNPNIVICAEEEELIRKDGDGAIYELSDEDFKESPQKEISDYEMVSDHPVRPLNRTVYTSTIDALTSAGIKIRFTDKRMFHSLIRNPRQKNMIEGLDLYKPKK